MELANVIEAQQRHEKSPKKGQVMKPDAAPRGTPHMFKYHYIFHCSFKSVS